MALLQRVRTGTALLFGHQLAELGFIHLHALVGGHFERDFNREAVSVMQLEGILAGHEIRAALLGLRHGHVEDLGAGFERAAERVLLTVGGFGHVVEGVVKLRIARFHRGLEVGSKVGMTGSVTPSSRMALTVRRSRRRST